LLDKLRGRRIEARLLYKDAEYQVRSPGDFVRCAVTGVEIDVTNLKYWSVERQEAYVDCAAAVKRHLELRDQAKDR